MRSCPVSSRVNFFDSDSTETPTLERMESKLEFESNLDLSNSDSTPATLNATPTSESESRKQESRRHWSCQTRNISYSNIEETLTPTHYWIPIFVSKYNTNHRKFSAEKLFHVICETYLNETIDR